MMVGVAVLPPDCTPPAQANCVGGFVVKIGEETAAFNCILICPQVSVEAGEIAALATQVLQFTRFTATVAVCRQTPSVAVTV
jgi:hypothetical protein